MNWILVSRAMGVAALAGLTLAVAHAAESPQAHAVRACLERQLQKPSVHDEREAIDRALAEAGVSQDTILGLHHAAVQANLPSMTASLDAFLFFTSDPRWQSCRKHFAEFLELPNVSEVDAATMRILADYDGVVTLPAITELTPKSAKECRHFGAGGWGAALEFPNVSTIPPEAARALATCEALLVFPHLRELSLETARRLAASKGTGLVLGGLTTLPADVAEALATIQAERGLLLPDLVDLDSEPLAKKFSRQDHAFFPSVRRMTPRIASALRGSEGGELSLPSLDKVTLELAKEFVGAGYYWLSLGGAGELAPDVAAVLATHHGPLVFPGHDAFSCTVAAKLAAHEHAIVLPHIANVPDDLLRGLVNHRGPLLLASVSSLTADQAKALARHAGPVSLPSFDRLTPEVAAFLAPKIEIDDIELPALTTIDATSAAALVSHSRNRITLDGLTDLSPESASALAQFEGTLWFPGITTLSAETARTLAAHRGPLVLGVTEDLESDAMAALVKHAGDLSLLGVTSVSDELGEVLAAAPGTLNLPSVSHVERQAARMLLARPKPLELGNMLSVRALDSPELAELIVRNDDDVVLDHVTSLTGPESVEVAKKLVRAKGELSLPALTHVSAGALEVLLARPGTELPDLANVKIVRDPGQLSHDDFIEPRP